MKFELRSVSYTYDVLPVINDVSVVFPESGITVLCGATGSGKTTLLKLLACDMLPSQGTVYINGQSTSVMKTSQKHELRRKIGVVYQQSKLSPHYTVEENLMVPLLVCGMKQRESLKHTMDFLSIHELSYLRDKFPHQLSGGEKQLLSIMRALIHDPDFIFADEPTEYLDNDSLNKIAGLFTNFIKEEKGLMLSTHSDLLLSHFPNAHRFDLVAGSLTSVHNKRIGFTV